MLGDYLMLQLFGIIKKKLYKKGLIQAYEDGEKLIGDVLFNRTS
jgi:hypothetical protein